MADEAQTLSDGREFQNLVVADSSGSANVTIWGDWIDTVVLGNSYNWQNMRVKMWQGEKILYTPRQGVVITEIEDININAQGSQIYTVQQARVASVKNLQTFMYCIDCNAVVKAADSNPQLGECTRCKSTMLLESCDTKITALLTLLIDSKKITLKAAMQELDEITEGQVSKWALLSAELFTVEHNGDRILKVCRNTEESEQLQVQGDQQTQPGDQSVSDVEGV